MHVCKPLLHAIEKGTTLLELQDDVQLSQIEMRQQLAELELVQQVGPPPIRRRTNKPPVDRQRPLLRRSLDLLHALPTPWHVHKKTRPPCTFVCLRILL